MVYEIGNVAGQAPVERAHDPVESDIVAVMKECASFFGRKSIDLVYGKRCPSEFFVFYPVLGGKNDPASWDDSAGVYSVRVVKFFFFMDQCALY